MQQPLSCQLVMPPPAALDPHLSLGFLVIMPPGDEELDLLDTLTMEPFPSPLEHLLLPAGCAAAAAGLAFPEGVEMREVAREVLPGSAREFASVRLAAAVITC